MFIRTTAINKLRKLKKRTKIVQGSSSAGKTYGILAILIDIATKNNNLEISVVSETIPHLRRGAIKDFLKLMTWTNRINESNWNKTLLTYTFANGSYIEFFSADQENKIRGARRDVLYINECNNIHFETYHQLSIRTNKEIWLDYNPSAEFWAHTELMNEPDSDFIIITYKDNEALNEAIINEIEKAKEKGKTSNYWENWYKVYGLGQLGSVQGTIFANWQQIDTIPNDARLLGIGLDFGYSVDPTACIGIYKYNDSYILHELIYQKELSNKNIFDLIKSEPTMVICDSAEPKSIAELQSYGLKCMGALKGKDSILHGIQLIQQQKLLVTKHSTNLIKELRSYVWATDRDNKPTGNPIEINNHLMDAMRYGFTHIIQQPGLGTYRIR
jgi:phage terminase large subunit